MPACPCGSGLALVACCGRYLAGESAPAAEVLMRSRYTAFVMQDEAYLLATWHPSTRPPHLGLAQETPRPQWLGLKILGHQSQDATHATVEFVARQKIAGRAYRLHEVSRFVLESGRWFYVDGDAG
ncbi:YchJ family protein [Sulfuriferula sp. AH1]|uniref:YchJ family protein n=1 Tax=Sulfuriferula sp. AH1 TaxID=1985873 RepID=UPI001CB97F4D|nr:YchJ family metal-binding protein [Sulfuriferula sp. AH1]